MKLDTVVAAAAIVALLGAGTTGAQLPEVLREMVEVRVVNVDVQVVDAEGEPVHGLTAEEFRLFEDGEPVELTNFLALEVGRVAAPPAGPTAAAPTPSPAPESPWPPAEPLRLLVFLDNENLMPAGRRRVAEDLADSLERQLAAQPDLEAMIVAATPTVAQLTPFTRDARQIRAALASLLETTPGGVRREADYRRTMAVIREIWELRGCRDFDRMVAEAAQYAAQRRGQAEQSLTRLGQVVASMAGLPGRKGVLFVGDGEPHQPGARIFLFLGELCADRLNEMAFAAMEQSITGAVEQVTGAANAGRVTLYTLDAAGLRTYSASSVENDLRVFVPSVVNDAAHFSNLQSPLWALAEQTGGRAILDTNRPGGEIERVARDFASYYSLGFRPDRPADGAMHRIRVELAGRNRGIRLRYRPSYQDRTEAEKLVQRALSAGVLGVVENPLSVQVTVGRATRDGRRARSVPVEIVVPSEGLESISEAAGPVSYLGVVLTSRDETGRWLPVRQNVVPLRAGGVERHSIVVQMPLERGENRIVVAVRDELSRVASFMTHSVRLE
ncbi:MAG: VWA domain-containing protein [Thermoanaerobaculia bacterium]|nr:VWA domain-containing protein [Thermoanaerobaculia bacterium]